MTNGEKLYIHYDKKIVPILFQYWDEERKIDKEYKPVADTYESENITLHYTELAE
jgi:hypothetical protein